MLRCDVSCTALPQQPPCQRHARRSAPPPPHSARCTGARRHTTQRSRVYRPARRAAARDDDAAPSAPPPAPSGAPLWVVPWDDGVSATVCARFAFLWCAIGFAGPSLVQQMAGSVPLAADARAEAQLALELLKAAAAYQLARCVLLASRRAAHALTHARRSCLRASRPLRRCRRRCSPAAWTRRRWRWAQRARSAPPAQLAPPRQRPGASLCSLRLLTPAPAAPFSWSYSRKGASCCLAPNAINRELLS